MRCCSTCCTSLPHRLVPTMYVCVPCTCVCCGFIVLWCIGCCARCMSTACHTQTPPPTHTYSHTYCAPAQQVRNVRLVSKRWCALATDVLLADTAVSKYAICVLRIGAHKHAPTHGGYTLTTPHPHRLPPPALPSLSRRFFNSEQHGHITTHHEVSMSRNPAVTRRKGARARARGRGQAAVRCWRKGLGADGGVGKH